MFVAMLLLLVIPLTDNVVAQNDHSSFLSALNPNNHRRHTHFPWKNKHQLYFCPPKSILATCAIYTYGKNIEDVYNNIMRCKLIPKLQWETSKFFWITQQILRNFIHNPDNRTHGANMGPTWVLPTPDGPHVGPMSLAIWEEEFEIFVIISTFPFAVGMCAVAQQTLMQQIPLTAAVR